jgi:predicted metal-binding protein
MTKIGIIGCKVSMDTMCPGCAKCFHALNKREGKFKDLGDDVEFVFLTSCGGCPGMIPVKMDLMNRILDTMGEEVDAVYIATCIQRAYENFGCPIDIGLVKSSLEKKGIKVVIGTHEYPVYSRG